MKPQRIEIPIDVGLENVHQLAVAEAVLHEEIAAAHRKFILHVEAINAGQQQTDPETPYTFHDVRAGS